jgi:SAM-dependent methyltransferase
VDDPQREGRSSLEEPPPSTQPDLYDYPEVYAALRAPDPKLLAGVQRLLREHLGDAPPGTPRVKRHGGRRSIMDPACGPANWLEPFARDGWYVAGNDLSPEMVAGARRALARLDVPHEITRGDMRALTFKSGPFDAAFEIAGSTGLLQQPEDLLAHLTTVGRHLRPEGLFLVTIFFDHRTEVDDPDRPRLCHLSEPVPVQLANGAKGQARARYEQIGWNHDLPAARMRRTVTTRGLPGCPAAIVEEYELRAWSESDVLALIDRTNLFDVVLLEGLPEPTVDDSLGENTLVLRRRPA